METVNYETLFKAKPLLQVLTLTDILKAHHLGISVGAFLARQAELERQIVEVNGRGQSAT